MTDSRAAVGYDRLPWLSDEPKPRAKGRASELAGWAIAGALAIAGGAYWLGTQSVDQAPRAPREGPATPRPEARVKLPEARAPSLPPPPPIAETPEIVPAPSPTVSIAEPRPEARARPKKRAVLKRESPSRARIEETVKAQTAKSDAPSPRAAAPVANAGQPPVTSRRPALWPARQSSGASGRLVQIGAFGSRQQAKLGWRRMVRSYPAMGRLPAVVVSSRNSRGKRFYRFQIGTTSQAHSEVLCQRMQRIRYSCAVVGLPWKAKVER